MKSVVEKNGIKWHSKKNYWMESEPWTMIRLVHRANRVQSHWCHMFAIRSVMHRRILRRPHGTLWMRQAHRQDCMHQNRWDGHGLDAIDRWMLWLYATNPTHSSWTSLPSAWNLDFQCDRVQPNRPYLWQLICLQDENVKCLESIWMEMGKWEFPRKERRTK